MFAIPVAPSVTEAVATLVTPNENRTEHSITVTCTVHSESDAGMCVVMVEQLEKVNSYIMNETSHAFYIHIRTCVCTYLLICIVYICNTEGVPIISSTDIMANDKLILLHR